MADDMSSRDDDMNLMDDMNEDTQRDLTEGFTDEDQENM